MASILLIPSILPTVVRKPNVVILRKCRFGACIWEKDNFLIKAKLA